jgi:hypothetical protein
MKYKRISNGEIMDLTLPMYIQWDGINGYLILSIVGEIYHFYSMDDSICMQCVTQYFIKV